MAAGYAIDTVWAELEVDSHELNVLSSCIFSLGLVVSADVTVNEAAFMFDG